MNVAVIGSGIAGLASAIRLANKGHRVTVFEKNNYPGGKIAQIKLGPYRFDTGPSLFTLPELVEELYKLSGVDIKKHFTYTKLQTICNYFYPDGSRLNFYHDRDKLFNEIRNNTSEDPSNLEKHLKKARDAYLISADVFIFNSLHKFSNYLSDPYKNILFKLHKLDFFRTMHRANRKLFRDKKIVQLFDRYATYNGSNPYKAPATLNIIAHLENNTGAFFPDKGMYAIADSLYRLAVDKGVNFSFNTMVDEIVIRDKRVTGLKIMNDTYYFDLIISDSDIRYLANTMMKHPRKSRINRQEPSSSALIYYWGVKNSFPELDIHNIIFSADHRTEFRKIFKERTLPDDPTIYIFISSKLVPEDAPAGCENWFVMVNAPPDTGQDWNSLVEKTRKNIISKINSTLTSDIENHIKFESYATPVNIEEKTLSTGGALYGNSSNSIFAAFLRHPNFLPRIKNLYFVGGSVHPGGGIPLCLASAGIVDKEIPEA